LRARTRRGDEVVEERAPAPVDDEVTDEDAHIGVEEQPSVWKSRLNDVAGSVSAWSSDDIERLRVD
jgi:hypothetical protein